jgi:glycosyltransferase involved in cell wall biosynthesis
VGDRPRDRVRVVVVAQAEPAQGGIATFAQTIVGDPELNRSFDMRVLNTTRRAVRVGGALSASNAWHAIVDSVRVYRAARRSHVVHVQTALLPLLPLVRAAALCAAARLGGAAVLCHVHTGLANVGPNEEFEPRWLVRWLLRRFRRASRVLTVSRPGMMGLRLHMPEARIETVDNAVDLASFEPADVDAEVPRLLFVGTLARRKGLLDLLEALRLLRTSGIDRWRMEIVGAGNEAGDEEAEVVRRAFAAAGLDAALLGPLGGTAVRERLRSASIYVLPSHSEGQPIGILEAMASGLPVVATRVGAIPEMVRHGVEGFLVDPAQSGDLADALASLIGSSELRRRMGLAARKRAEDDYGVEKLRARLADLYQAVTRELGHPGGCP